MAIFVIFRAIQNKKVRRKSEEMNPTQYGSDAITIEKAHYEYLLKCEKRLRVLEEKEESDDLGDCLDCNVSLKGIGSSDCDKCHSNLCLSCCLKTDTKPQGICKSCAEKK